MAPKIKIMDEALASKIAAGEVVERPASVVKELVENSIDAGAAEVTVHVAEGGRRLIKVADNGEGMDRTDATIALSRHATSKISSEKDLNAIGTLGFRGEALWSIAAVSRVKLITRRAEDRAGTLVRAEGGTVVEVLDHGCPAGTIVEVGDLFFNTPARARFLRTPGTEFSRILDLVKRIALAYPEIRFRLFHGPSKVLDARAGRMDQRLADIFGTETAGKLIHVEGPVMEGFVASPQVSFTSAKGIFTYVNRRAVTDRGLNRSIILGYGQLLDDSRYPFAFVNLRLDPSEVDVNVHPAKSEVRFRNPRRVYEEVRAAIKNSLAGSSMSFERKRVFDYGYGGASHRQIRIAEHRSTYMPERTGTETQEHPSTEAFKEQKEPLNPEFLEMEVVGQLWGEFLVAEGGDEFYIIDQHAAAERTAFERLKREFSGNKKLSRQMLLLPERLETTPDESAALKKAMRLLDRLGFDIIPFGPCTRKGGETYLIKAVPEMLSKRNTVPLVRDLLEELSDGSISNRVEESIEGVLMRIACHSVIRGPRRLADEELRALLRDLSTVDFAAFCPHGRPVIKRFSRKEIETLFKR